MWDSFLQSKGHRIIKEKDGVIITACRSGRGYWQLINGELILIEIKEL